MSLRMRLYVRNGVSDRNSEATPCVVIDFGDLIHPLRAGSVSDLCRYERLSTVLRASLATAKTNKDSWECELGRRPIYAELSYWCWLAQGCPLSLPR